MDGDDSDYVFVTTPPSSSYFSEKPISPLFHESYSQYVDSKPRRPPTPILPAPAPRKILKSQFMNDIGIELPSTRLRNHDRRGSIVEHRISLGIELPSTRLRTVNRQPPPSSFEHRISLNPDKGGGNMVNRRRTVTRVPSPLAMSVSSEDVTEGRDGTDSGIPAVLVPLRPTSARISRYGRLSPESPLSPISPPPSRDGHTSRDSHNSAGYAKHAVSWQDLHEKPLPLFPGDLDELEPGCFGHVNHYGLDEIKYIFAPKPRPTPNMLLLRGQYSPHHLP